MFYSKGLSAAVLFVFLQTTSCPPPPAPPPPLGFASEKNYAAGKAPGAVAVGDFDGDTKLDLAVANSGSANVSILLGKGDGTFQPSKNFGVGQEPSSIAPGDLNSDTRLDLVVANKADGNLSFLLGNGDGTFQAAANFSVGKSPSAIAVGDFNGDNLKDLVVTNSADGNISFLKGNGNGTFLAAQNFGVGPSPLSIAISDFNGDAKLDVAVADSNGVSTLLGNGDGTFQPAVSNSVGGPALSVAAGDFNADAKPDLAVARKDDPSSGTSGGVSFLLGNGDGTFQPFRILLNAPVCCLALDDFNGDGKLDIGAVGTASGLPGLIVLAGKGTGIFFGSQAYFLDTAPISLAAGEFNGDKFPEVVMAKSETDSVGVLLNTTGPTGADPSVRMVANPSPAIVGQDLTYTVFVNNRGPQNATGVTLTDTLPAGVQFVSAGSCQGASVITCNFSSVLRGGIARATIVVVPTTTGTITNSANVTTTGSDLDAGNDSETISTLVNPASGFTLQVVKGGTGSGAVSSSPSGIDCGNRCFVNFASGTMVTLTATAESGSSFAGWSGACTGTGDCLLTMNANHSVTASFSANPLVTLNVARNGTGSGRVTSSPSGIDCGSTCSANYNMGKTISLTAAADANSVFANWSGACTGTDPNNCAVSMSSDQSVTATFNLPPPPDFTISSTSTSLMVRRGGQVSEVLTIAGQGGFSGTIALACSVSGPSPMPTCSISPNSVTPGNSATLTVNAAALSASLPAPLFEQGARLYAAWLPLGLLGCVLATGFDKKRRRLWALCLLLIVATILPAACGGGSNSPPPPPPPQNFTVTVTATSGALQHSTTISVTVQ